MNETVTKNRPIELCQDFSKAICSITLKFDLKYLLEMYKFRTKWE